MTCVRNSRGIRIADLVNAVGARGYALANGYGKLKEETFRLGHMGEHTVSGLEAFLTVVDEELAPEPARRNVLLASEGDQRLAVTLPPWMEAQRLSE